MLFDQLKFDRSLNFQMFLSHRTLNGLVYRKGGKSTVWLNGTNSYEGNLASEYFRINAGDINSEKVSVTVPDVGLEFDLKVGQTYEPNDGTLLDIVDNDVPFVIE